MHGKCTMIEPDIFVAVEDDIVTGYVVLNPLNSDKTKTQLMQMAVETDLQAKGIGNYY